MDQMHEYHGELTFAVADGNVGPVLRFIRDNETVTEVHFSYAGARELAAELIRKSRDKAPD